MKKPANYTNVDEQLTAFRKFVIEQMDKDMNRRKNGSLLDADLFVKACFEAFNTIQKKSK